MPKREKARILAAMQSSRLKTQESKVLAEMTDDGKIIETVVRAHYDTCDYTRNKMEPFLAKARASPSYAVCTGTVSSALFLCHERVTNLPIRMHYFCALSRHILLFFEDIFSKLGILEQSANLCLRSVVSGGIRLASKSVLGVQQ